MERMTPHKKTPEHIRLEQAEDIELLPGELTPEQEADLRDALSSIDSPNAQKKARKNF
jgi:hypothetical protein